MKYIKSLYPFIFPAICAAILFSVDLGQRSLWLDEGASLSIASQHGSALSNALARDGGNMLIYYLLLHLIITIFGNSPVILRLPSVIGGILSVLGISLVCAKLFNNRIAVTSALLTAVSLPFIYWSQNARSYTLLAAAVIWSYYFLIMVLRAIEENHPKRWHLIGYGFCILLGAYMSFIAILVVIPQLILLLQYKKPLREFITALSIDALLCIPLAILAIERGSGQLFWIEKPSWQITTTVIDALVSTNVANNFYPVSSAPALVNITSLLILLGLILAVIVAWLIHKKKPVLRSQRNKGKNKNPSEAPLFLYQKHNMKIEITRRYAFGLHLVAWWLVFPSLAILIESWLGQSIYNPKYFFPFTAPVSILICYILFSDIIKHKVMPYIGFLVFALLIVLRLASVIPNYGISPENWRQPTEYLIQNYRPHDCVAFYPEDTRTLVSYYLSKDGPQGKVASRLLVPILPTVALTKMPSYVEDYVTLSPRQLDDYSKTCDRIWLISSHQGLPNSTAISYRHYIRFERLYQSLGKIYPIVNTTTYGWSATVDVTLFRR